jgi:hypothetical protein
VEPFVTMPEIARLANVTRQAVTNWRSRPASTPFPAPVKVVDGIERFDRDEILDWLEATGRGRNREARLDAPAVVAPPNLDVERAVVLLGLRAKVAEDIGPLTAEERIALAEQIDPDDTYLLAEVRHVAQDDALAVYVDELLEAAYGPSDALSRLYDTRPAQGARGLSAGLIALLQSVADACRTYLGPDGVSVELRLEPRARQVAAAFQSADGSAGAHRAMLRHLALDGLSVEQAAGALVRIVSVVGRADSESLDLADEAALELEDGQVAIVVGPATALCDRLVGDLYDARRKTLEMGALTAAFKLPRGMWREAHRQNLGLWVLRGGAETTGVLVADLSGREGGLGELPDDILGALEQTGARAYRYGRVVPYNEVWTRDTVVLPGIGATRLATPGVSSAHERVVEATLVTREQVDGFDIPLVAQGGAPRPSPRSLGELVEAGAIKVQSGSRISPEHLDPDGTIAVLSADPSAPHGRIDALVAADHYAHAARTEQGDVVFAVAPVPRALVDEEGGSRVASPSRILRVDLTRAGIGPRALAAAINQMATSSEWKTWPVPNVPRSEIHRLEEALGGVLDYVAKLRRHEDAATNIITNLIQGVAEGSVALGSSTTERKAG